MQELKSDLVLTKEITLNSFSAIKKQEIKDACIKVVELTLNSIITRIDTELLAMEKEQMCKFAYKCHNHYKVNGDFKIEQYYNETFKSE